MRLYLFASLQEPVYLETEEKPPTLEVESWVFPSLQPDFSAPENADI